MTCPPWRSQINIAIDKQVPGSDMMRIPGGFMTRVFEGPYKDMGKHVKAMRSYA
jgi:hypothetical protein